MKQSFYIHTSTVEKDKSAHTVVRSNTKNTPTARQLSSHFSPRERHRVLADTRGALPPDVRVCGLIDIVTVSGL